VAHDLRLSFTSQAGLEHCSSHFGRGQVVGLAQDHEQEVSSQRGAQLALGATQVVWHWAGAQTVSHYSAHAQHDTNHAMRRCQWVVS
jgi:hypothetical protein